MAAPAKTSEAAIVAAALELARQTGANFSINAVADAVGVKPASLYKRFADRSAVVARMQVSVFEQLRTVLEASLSARTPFENARAMANAYRRFALEHPKLYSLLFTNDGADDPAVHEARVRALAPALDTVRAIVGADRALDATRAFTAYVHGFVSMLIANAFHMGGDVDRAFEFGVDTLLRGFVNINA